MQKLLQIMFIILGGLLVYRFRYRLFNLLLGQRFLRSFFIRLSMRMPFFRDKFLQRAFY